MHLLHPALVHFAIAFLMAGGLLEAWGIFGRRERAARFGGALVIAGTIILAPTVASGFIAVNSVSLPVAAVRTASNHERVGIVILITYIGLLLWKGWHRGAIPQSSRPIYAGMLLIAVALVAYGAFLGGRLVYGFGVGTSLSFP